MTGSFAKADPRPRSSRSTMKRITTLALIVLTAACSPESDARPDAAAGDDAGPAAAVGDVPADLTCETLRESVLRSGTDRDALSNAWGTPESVRVSTEPNRHIEGATFSLAILLAVPLVTAPLLAVPVHADSATERKLAEELLTLMNVKEMSEQALKEMSEVMPPGETPDAAESRQAMIDLMQKAMSWDGVKDDYIAIYADLFDENDLRAYVAFFRSPAGRKYVDTTPELTKRTMEVGAKRMQAIVPQLQKLMERQAGEQKP
jgi:hypothetical protein